MRRFLVISCLVVLTAGGACGSGDDKTIATPTTATPGGTGRSGENGAFLKSPFEARPYDDVRDALESAGLGICDTYDSGADASGAFEGKTWDVVRGSCPVPYDDENHGLVVVDAYNSKATRDKNAASPFGDKIIGYAFGKFVVSITESSRPEVLELFRKAMDSLRGAELGYDRR